MIDAARIKSKKTSTIPGVENSNKQKSSALRLLGKCTNTGFVDLFQLVKIARQRKIASEIKPTSVPGITYINITYNGLKWVDENTASEITGIAIGTLRNQRSLGTGIPFTKVGETAWTDWRSVAEDLKARLPKGAWERCLKRHTHGIKAKKVKKSKDEKDRRPVRYDVREIENFMESGRVEPVNNRQY